MFNGSYEIFEDEQRPHFRRSTLNALTFIPHLHRQYELIYVVEGAMEAHIQGTSHLLRAGELSLALSHQLHSYATREPGKYYMCIFEPELVPQFSDHIRKKELGMPYLTDCTIQERQELSLLIERIFDPAREGELRISGYMTALLALMAEKTGVMTAQGPQRASLLQQALTYIAQNYDQGITLQSAAQALGLSHFYLSRLFNQQTGYSFPEYMMHFRINHARGLLVGTDRAIYDIALASGFECTRSFNRAFVRVTGMTPSQYRKQAQAQTAP